MNAARVEDTFRVMTPSHSNGTSCFRIGKDEAFVALALKSFIGVLASAVCLVAIVLIIIFKRHKKFVYRLVIYFMTADLLQSVCQVLETVPVTYDQHEDIAFVEKGPWEIACATFGFMDQLSQWMTNCVIIWIMIYLLSKVYLLVSVQHNDNIKKINAWKQSILSRKEKFGLLLVLIIPFTFNWVPFIFQMYGFSGLFCWIKLVANNECDVRKLNTILMFTMFYCPLFVLVICEFLCVVMATTGLCISVLSKEKRGESLKLTNTMKEMSILIILPLLYLSLFSILVANRVYSISHPESGLHPLWSAHLIADPGRLLVSPIAFLCLPVIWKVISGCKRSKHSHRVFIVQAESEDIDQPLAITGENSCESSSHHELLLDSML